MIIWRGRGLAIAVIAFGCLVVAEFIVEAALRDPNYYQAHGWPKLLGFWLGAAAVYALRSWLGVPESPLAPTTWPGGGTHPGRPEGELFFVKARYWPPILVFLGLVFLFLKE